MKSITTYRNLIGNIERLCKFLAIVEIQSVVSMTGPFFLYTFINYYILDVGEKSFLLPLPATLVSWTLKKKWKRINSTKEPLFTYFFNYRWPFNWKTPLGYFIAWFLQVVGVSVSHFTATVLFNFFLGSCWLFFAMAEDITKDLVAFNNDVKRNDNPEERIKLFCDIVQLYSDAKK